MVTAISAITTLASYMSAAHAVSFRSVCLFLLVAFNSVAALDFPHYSFRQHPFYRFEQFSALQKSPAIVQRYMLRRQGRDAVKGAIFLPRKASYLDLASGQAIGESLDALYVPAGSTKDTDEKKFLTVTLSKPARLFLLLMTKGRMLSTLDVGNAQVDGLSKDVWTGLRILRSESNDMISIPVTERRSFPSSFPRDVVAVESIMTVGEFVLPHPRSISIDGKLVRQYHLLFAKPDSIGTPARAFEYQEIPATVTNMQTGQEINTEPVVPNETCPDWVHDLYVTESRDGDVAAIHNELPYWRTWHPQIDPMFWCYFSHEHGSYPGEYEPALGYTAWKTLDNSTTHKRQIESNEGFKVFAIPLHEYEKFVVIVVHMHVSQPRRFTARHHTIILTVLDKQWNTEMELHFKMDFGFAHASLVGGGHIPFNNDEETIADELDEKYRFAGRRFNVLNIDDSYPTTVNTTFVLNGRATPTIENKHKILRGIYEQWTGPLNTCSGTTNMRRNRGFTFDVRDPSTAKRTMEGGKDEEMTMLGGNAVNRVLKIQSGGVTVGLKDCGLTIGEEALEAAQIGQGVFYTDSKFNALESSSGLYSMRQYIKPDFAGISFPAGKLSPTDGWGGFFDYQEDKMASGRKFLNVEDAALPQLN